MQIGQIIYEPVDNEMLDLIILLRINTNFNTKSDVIQMEYKLQNRNVQLVLPKHISLITFIRWSASEKLSRDAERKIAIFTLY